MKAGFSVVAVLISMMLGTVLMTTVFSIYNSISRTARFAQRVSHEDVRQAVIVERLQKDFLGIAAVSNSDATGDDSTAQGSSGSSDDIEGKFFYSVNQGESLDFLTFITTSSLPAYGESRPSFIRVVYRVESDPNRAGLFRLMRKEVPKISDKVSETDLKGGVFSELSYGISAIKMTYYFFKKSGDSSAQSASGAASSAEKTAAAAQKISETAEWNPADETMKNSGAVTVPYAVKVEMSFKDGETVAKDLDFRIEILSDVSLALGSFQSASDADSLASTDSSLPSTNGVANASTT
jgi:hypothetical protein